jgi:hypothetical protein
VIHTLVAKLTYRVPAYCGVQRRALPDWLMMVGKFIYNGIPATTKVNLKLPQKVALIPQ